MSRSRAPEPVRLALAITELEIGGAERCLVNLATRLDRQQFSPVVYALAGRPFGPRGALVAQLEQAGIPVHFLGLRRNWQFPMAVGRLARLLAEQAPDVLQTFLFHANVVGAVAGRRAGVGAVATGVRVADPRRWRQHVERLLAGRVARVVCVSQSVAEFCRQQVGLPADKLVVIPNGLVLDDYPAAGTADLLPLGIAPGKPVLLYVGRLDRQKGVDWLLQSAPRLLEQLPDHHLLLVGDGPQRAELGALCRGLALNGRVHLAGWRADVPQILRQSELLILPSRWEGMPNVLLEAMASALPVVGTRVSGVEELLGPLAGEQTVPPGDSNALVARVTALARDPAHARRLGQLNRQRVQEHFSLGATVAAYQQLYAGLARR